MVKITINFCVLLLVALPAQLKKIPYLFQLALFISLSLMLPDRYTYIHLLYRVRERLLH